MFTLTDDEKAALDNATKLSTEVQEKSRALRGLGYGATPESREQAQAEFDAAKKAADEFSVKETFLVAMLKTEANKMVAEKLPGGSFPALLTIAEQMLAALDTENGQRTTGLAKNVVLRVLGAGADMDIHMARARITKARYDSLLEVGLPEDLVREILIAEASKPMAFPQMAASSRK